MEGGAQMFARAVGVNFDIVADGVGGEQPVGGAQLELFFGHDFLEQVLCFGEQFGGGFAVFFVLEIFG